MVNEDFASFQNVMIWNVSHITPMYPTFSCVCIPVLFKFQCYFRTYQYLISCLTFLHIHRFTAEEKAKRHPCAYSPFGLGPRNCVGMRFALMEAKMALIEIVRNFKIELSPETKVKVYIPTIYCSSVYI